MINMLKNKCTYISTIFMFLAVISFSTAKAPLTIPGIKEWADSDKRYLFSSTSKIVIDIKYKNELSEVANTLKEDLKDLKGFETSIISAASPSYGDIYLTLALGDPRLGDEGYELNISEKFNISAPTETGVFWATRTFLQLVKQSDTIVGGSALDWPDYKERGFMIDNGRKYFSIDWINKHIKELSYFKLNVLHFHISENEGFRMECERYPEITSAEHYTKKQLKEFIKLGEKYHVMILPEIDMPSHMDQILMQHQELTIIDSNNHKITNLIDITRDTAITFAKNLIEEYIDFFPCKYWHMGADEYMQYYGAFPALIDYSKKRYGPNAVPQDVLFGFINTIDTLVRSHGKTLRIWNDCMNNTKDAGCTVGINKDVIIEYWIGDTIPQKLIDSGHKMVNCNSDYLYFDVGNGWRPNAPYIYQYWRPNVFYRDQVVKPDFDMILGSKIQLWVDIPRTMTEVQIAKELKKPFRSLAQVNWDSRVLDTLFTRFEIYIDSIGYAPGVDFNQNPLPNDLAYGKKVVSSSNENPSYIPEAIVDGDYNTRWSSKFTDNEWIYVDLGESLNFTRIKLFWEYSFGVDYEIQTSDNTVDWNTIYHETKGNGGEDDYVNLPGKGRYVRIKGNKRINTCGFSLWEMEIYDSTSIVSVKDYDAPVQNRIINVKSSPNPFVSNVNISYEIQDYCDVKIAILDKFGRKLARLVNEEKAPGVYQVDWNAATLPSGEYYCRIEAGKYTYYERLVLVK